MCNSSMNNNAVIIHDLKALMLLPYKNSAQFLVSVKHFSTNQWPVCT